MPLIKVINSVNCSSRDGRQPIAIVDHITAGRYPGCLHWLCDPDSRASAHFLVTKIGEIFQLVDMEKKAWHAGVVINPNWRFYDGTNPNRYTIGIEHEGQSGDWMPEEQYQATLWLHKFIMGKYPVITPNNDRIIGHSRINADHSGCPGTGFPWTRLFMDLNIKEENIVDHVIVFWTTKDFSPAIQIAERLDNCLISCRDGKPPINTYARAAKHLIVVGGPEIKDHPNVTNLCGTTGPDTAILAANYAKKI